MEQAGLKGSLTLAVVSGRAIARTFLQLLGPDCPQQPAQASADIRENWQKKKKAAPAGEEARTKSPDAHAVVH
jgi:hypothetical protein